MGARTHFFTVMILVLTALSAFAAEPVLDHTALRKQAEKAQSEGNLKDAWELYEKLTLSSANDPSLVCQDLTAALTCLRQLNRTSEMDSLRERAVEAHRESWRIRQAVANSYALFQDFYGYLIAGVFERGGHRGGGRAVGSFARDRVRSLQLMAEAERMICLDALATADEKSRLSIIFANVIANFANQNESWRLQYLTDLTTLPDYEEGGRWYQNQRNSGAPVTRDGSPVYHQIPESWEKAASDGERWRWLLHRADTVYPECRQEIRSMLAGFAHQQFGVETLAYGRWVREEDETSDQSGIFALHTLKDDETIARLATGIRRFTLPEDYNFIRIWKEQKSYYALASHFENRRQYKAAAEFWTLHREEAKGNVEYAKSIQAKIDQIQKPWGQFEPSQTHPAGRGAKIDYRFRNGMSVSFSARSIRVKELLDEIKAYIKSSPRNEDWRYMDPQHIGFRLVEGNQKKFLGEETAAWTLPLEAKPDHFDRRITVTTPLQKAGAYLIEAKMKDGNISRIIVWVDDTVLVKKPLDGKQLLYVADSVTGEPVEEAYIECFGYRREWRNEVLGAKTVLKSYANFTDRDGLLTVDESNVPSDLSWLITATTRSGRLAFLGFTGIWYGQRHDAEYNERKTYVITDRPVYRPKEKVQFKFWVRRAQYDQEDTSDFAGSTFSVGIVNPKGEKIFEKNLKADEYGGFEGELSLPADATLGVYQIGFWNGSYLDRQGSFRTEEYKKPEFKVEVETASAPVMLGEKVKAKINAKYYFGSPVSDGTIKYKIQRFSQDSRWYPWQPWDWFYGNGYWWFAPDYEWYPGWQEWGCRRPFFHWYGQRQTPPELVAEGESRLAADGSYEVEIDTAAAKELHSDTDHRYEITAEVTDPSRRVITGTGKVLVARQPFRVYAWLDRGYYQAGETILASFKAQTLDQKPVQGKGLLTLYRLSWPDGEPQETKVEEWALDTSAAGESSLKIKASEAGQYRLAYRVTDSAEHIITGGYVFVIRGEGSASAPFRFNDLEIVTEQKEVAPGEKLKVMINTNRIGGTVLLFIRPSNGVYLPPEVIRMSGKSVVREIEVTKKDMPNFYLEAVTIADGRFFTETREVIVPPVKRILNLTVTPSATEFKPGQKAKVEVRLTDHLGKPFQGTTVLSVYDKALEYISGGANTVDIKEFFWKWRRQHQPQTEESLDRWFQNLMTDKETGMAPLGIFGHSVADEDSTSGLSGNIRGLRRRDGEVRLCKSMSNKMSVQATASPACAPVSETEAAYADVANEAKDAPTESGGDVDSEGAATGSMAEAAVRSHFADTAYWNGLLTTDAEGFASVEFNMPENLTAWMIKGWGMGHGTRVGEGTAEVVTRKNLILRLQSPRFFTEKDEVVLSANVHNYLPATKTAKVILELDGRTLSLMDGSQAEQSVEIKTGESKRVDWRVSVKEEGTAVIRMKALTHEESDAMEMSFPVQVHGMDKMVAQCGSIRPEGDQAAITFEVPKERRISASRLEIRYSPSLAGAMVDALPYLMEYPYGCTEQTLNRFVPLVITMNTLKTMGLSLKEIKEKRSNLNAQEIGDDAERAAQRKRIDRNPVFDEGEMQAMVKAGIDRLTAMQVSDGGWGWFSGYGEHSWPHTTATVVHGLQTAARNGAAVDREVIARGVAWLKEYEASQVAEIQLHASTKGEKGRPFADNTDALVYQVLSEADSLNGRMMDFLYRDREHLSVYAKALFGLALHNQKQEEKRDMLKKNIKQFLVTDKENQTAYLNLGNEGYWWYWYGSDIEAHAATLTLLARTEPKSEETAGLVKYLLNNRRNASYWNSTRDTASATEAFAEFIAASGEDRPEMTLEILIDGQKQKEVTITKENLFDFDNRLLLLGDAVESGTHRIELKKKGKGALYFSAYLSYFTLEDNISKAGLEIKVERKFYRLNRVATTQAAPGARGEALNEKVEKYEREELADLSVVKSGELVEVELAVASKNDYEYILFEDMKPAGFEAVDVRSGYVQNDLGAYVEFRDDRVSFFVQSLARGRHSVSYRLRAEIPGRFSALPARASAMYAPELRANSDELRLKIED